jgi:hypothetical protein
MDSNAKLLGMLGLMQNEGLGEDYLQRWPERIAAVTLADVQRVAQRVLQPEAMQLVVVGDKEALKAQGKPESAILSRAGCKCVLACASAPHIPTNVCCGAVRAKQPFSLGLSEFRFTT